MAANTLERNPSQKHHKLYGLKTPPLSWINIYLTESDQESVCFQVTY